MSNAALCATSTLPAAKAWNCGSTISSGGRPRTICSVTPWKRIDASGIGLEIWGGGEVVWVGAGSETHLAALHPGVLVRLARAQIVDAVQESTYHSAREEH